MTQLDPMCELFQELQRSIFSLRYIDYNKDYIQFLENSPFSSKPRKKSTFKEEPSDVLANKIYRVRY